MVRKSPFHPWSSAFVAMYFDTSLAQWARPLLQECVSAFAHLQGIELVCTDRISLPDDISEANAQLGAYNEADLFLCRSSEQSLMSQKEFEKAISGLFSNVQFGSPVWLNLLPDRYKAFYHLPE
ncbi:hypothetical protein [uncultured Duncaniella sp.]|nr:hypothetical protein [uncultured Duncaniella sp.]ROT13179.1 hypothetical protein EEL48_10705 [Muribaculaceae bacterium Isolate-102 (HZI)]